MGRFSARCVASAASHGALLSSIILPAFGGPRSEDASVVPTGSTRIQVLVWGFDLNVGGDIDALGGSRRTVSPTLSGRRRVPAIERTATPMCANVDPAGALVRSL